MLGKQTYAPVKEYLLNQGFTVRGEVRDCDLAAVKMENSW